MEPIKVDFSDGGKKKSVRSVLIPPEKAGIKIVINVVIMLITAAVTYYFMLPPLNLHDYKFYLYIAIVLGSYVAAAFVTSGAFAKPEYVPYVKRRALIPMIIGGAVLLTVVIGYLVSCPFFRAKDLSNVLKIDENGDFTKTVSLIDSMSDFDNVPLIDATAAQTLADKALGGFGAMGLESQYELMTEDSTQINYNKKPYRVYPLRYGNIFKWILKKSEGIPGYVKVDLNNQESAELVTKYEIKYSTAEHFSQYLERHLRFHFPTYIFGEISFEIDDSGNPYWVVEKIKKTVGLFGGEDVEGIILVNAVDGTFTEISAETLKTSTDPAITWVDQAFDADLLIRQYNNRGTYAGGFWNSIIGQSGVKQTSTGYSFLAHEDDVYLYTGITSVTSDNSIIGFFFINQRTKEATFYSTSGGTELAAQESAKGKVQDMGWDASFPILLNVDGEATYLTALKDSSNYVKSYALVNAQQVNIVAIPTDLNSNDTRKQLRSCMETYIQSLKGQKEIHFDFDESGNVPDEGADTPEAPKTLTASGAIAEILPQIVDGSTYYYIRLTGADTWYYIKGTVTNGLVLLKSGDNVTVTYKETEETSMIPADAVEGSAAPAPAQESEQPSEPEPTTEE